METSSFQFVDGSDQQQAEGKQQPQQSQQAMPLQPNSLEQPQQRQEPPLLPWDLSGKSVFEWDIPAPRAGETGNTGIHQDTAMLVSDDILMDNTTQSNSTFSVFQNSETWANVNSKPIPSSMKARPSLYVDTKSPTWTNDTAAAIITPTFNPQEYRFMDPKYQSLFFLQTAAEQEAVNKAIERENSLMHQHLIDMAQSKSVNALDTSVEEAREELRQQRIDEQAQKQETLAKENTKINLKLAQVQWRSPETTLVPSASDQRLQDFEQDRLDAMEEKRQEEERIAKENARLKLRLAQVQWKEPTHLDESVQERRKALKEERRKGMEERKHKNQILAKENAKLKQRLLRVQGKLSSHLDTTVEQRRLNLVEERRKSLDHLREAQARQAIMDPKRSTPRMTTKAPTNTTLDNSIEQRRLELEQQRRQKAERKRQELRAHTKAVKERLNRVKGKEQKSLDKATKSKRTELQEKRAKEKFRQEQERKKHSAAYRKRMSQFSQFLESDEYHDISPAANSKRFSFDHDERLKLQKERQEAANQKKKEELEHHKKEFLKRTRGIKRGRTNLSLDAEVEALRKDLAQKSISDNQERTEKIRKQNLEFHSRVKNAKARHSLCSLEDDLQEARSQTASKLKMEAKERRKTLSAENAKLKHRLSNVSGRETKSLSGVVQSLRSEREQGRKQALLQKNEELIQHEKKFKKRLSDVTSRDCMKLNDATQAVRNQRNAKRQSAVKEKQKELARHKAKLKKMVATVKSPIQQMISTTPSPTFAFSKNFHFKPMVTPSPLSIDTEMNTNGSFQSGAQVFDFQTMSTATTPESILEAAKSSPQKRLGQKRIVQACQRNQHLRDQNLKLRKRLAESAALSIQKLESTITP